MLSWAIRRAFLLTVLVMGIVLTAVSASALAGAGSWSAQVPGMMVAMSDRASASQMATPPAVADMQSGRLERVQWQFQHPPSALISTWLCHPQQCVELNGMRGSTTALAGRSADAPLHFRFALRPGQRPVRVQGLQLIVNYQ